MLINYFESLRRWNYRRKKSKQDSDSGMQIRKYRETTLYFWIHWSVGFMLKLEVNILLNSCIFKLFSQLLKIFGSVKGFRCFFSLNFSELFRSSSLLLIDFFWSWNFIRSCFLNLWTLFKFFYTRIQKKKISMLQ